MGIEFLGHIMVGAQIRPNLDLTAALHNMVTLVTKKQVRAETGRILAEFHLPVQYTHETSDCLDRQQTAH